MAELSGQASPGISPPLHFRVLAPDADGLSSRDLRRLFGARRLPAARRLRLERDCRILALCGEQVAGMVAYERTDRTLHALEFGIDPQSECGTREVANQLLEALELACVAGNVPTLVLDPPPGLFDDVLHARGYRFAPGSASGARYEKRFA